MSDSSPIARTAPVLVFGTGNRKKVAELAGLLAGLPVHVLSLADFSDAIEVAEVGTSFAENAALKATQQAAHLRQWVLADDSGLVVDALEGAPGIYSARYAGPGATDADNRRQLLEALESTKSERRTARFECALALADPAGVLRATSQGSCAGRIRASEAGGGGFGYDSLFEVVEYHRTFGELSAAVKGVLSHRARAVGQMLPQIEALIDSNAW